ncbi:MAG: hypothetical protein KDC26_04475 [Armatimonadetes bacterium]|nr:hypothetical protein [Armatimonadota bacterium]
MRITPVQKIFVSMTLMFGVAMLSYMLITSWKQSLRELHKEYHYILDLESGLDAGKKLHEDEVLASAKQIDLGLSKEDRGNEIYYSFDVTAPSKGFTTFRNEIIGYLIFKDGELEEVTYKLITRAL